MTADKLPQLNLPAYGARVRGDGVATPLQIHDDLRRRWVALTPEEWVRQHFVHYMIGGLGYSAFRIANEIGLRVGTRRRRSDTVVYDDRLQPAMVVEYKAPHIALTARVIEQIARYNLVYRAPYLTVTNGMRIICLHVDSFGDTVNLPHITPLRSLPAYADLTR